MHSLPFQLCIKGVTPHVFCDVTPSPCVWASPTLTHRLPRTVPCDSTDCSLVTSRQWTLRAFPVSCCEEPNVLHTFFCVSPGARVQDFLWASEVLLPGTCHQLHSKSFSKNSPKKKKKAFLLCFYLRGLLGSQPLELHWLVVNCFWTSCPDSRLTRTALGTLRSPASTPGL